MEEDQNCFEMNLKNIITLSFVLLAVALMEEVIAQNCLPEGITFITQSQIDSFQTLYPGCTVIEGNVTISGPDITNLDALNVLVSIEGNLEIKSNALLGDLTGLSNLGYLGGNLRIEQNEALINLQGFELLETLNGDLIIGDVVLGEYPYSTGNPLLTSLSGLNNLTSVQGNLKLCGNNSITSLSSLENLEFIGGNLQVGGLDFIYGFVFGNPLLVNLSGLDALSSIDGSLFIAGNRNLKNLSGLDNLNAIGQNAWFDLNDSLTSLQGMNQLASIGGSLQIRWNLSLLNITGLENIASHTIHDIEISYNQALSECHVKSICDYLADPGGEIYIAYNAPGCNSPEEVEAACETVGVENTVTGKEYLIFPNPANQLVTFTCNNGSTNLELTIFNQTGQKVYRGIPDNNTLDVSILKPGIYVVEVATKEGIVRKKLVVQ